MIIVPWKRKLWTLFLLQFGCVWTTLILSGVIFWAIPKGVSTAMIIFLCPRNHEAFSTGSGNRGRKGKTLGIIDQPFRPIIRAYQASGISYLTTVLTSQFFWIRSRSRSNTNDTLVDNQFINKHVYIQKYLPGVYTTKSFKKVKCLAFSTWILYIQWW